MDCHLRGPGHSSLRSRSRGIHAVSEPPLYRLTDRSAMHSAFLSQGYRYGQSMGPEPTTSADVMRTRSERDALRCRRAVANG
jgi:hypothetical protein